MDATSSGFLVDTSAPEIRSGPQITRDFSLVDNTQFYRSTIKVEWQVEDQESYVERQYLSWRRFPTFFNSGTVHLISKVNLLLCYIILVSINQYCFRLMVSQGISFLLI